MVGTVLWCFHSHLMIWRRCKGRCLARVSWLEAKSYPVGAITFCLRVLLWYNVAWVQGWRIWRACISNCYHRASRFIDCFFRRYCSPWCFQVQTADLLCRFRLSEGLCSNARPPGPFHCCCRLFSVHLWGGARPWSKWCRVSSWVRSLSVLCWPQRSLLSSSLLYGRSDWLCRKICRRAKEGSCRSVLL